MPYRPEIDGLRAVAVLLVLLFHARVPYVAGGFVGVDAFFVISGYLIASLVRAEIARGAFSFIHFYERRVRRILPALILVMASTLALAALLLLPDDLTLTSSSAVAASAFLANVYFARKVNYFEDESGSFPLLHLWSLSVEEQFYLVAPFALVLLVRFSPRHARAVIAAACVASLAFSTYETTYWPELAFYSSAGRAFELLLGIGLAFGNHAPGNSKVAAGVLPICGLALILAASLLFDRNTLFPGLAALLPCMGAVLIIAFARADRGLGRLLSWPGAVYLGRVSYPLYLWHWPLVVLAGQYYARELSAAEIALIYAIAFALAVATYHWLERPIAALWPNIGSRVRFGIPALSLSLVALAALGIWSTDGLPGRLPPEARSLLAAASVRGWGPEGCHSLDRRQAQFAERCAIGAVAKPTFDFALWGDSMANSFSPMIADVARQHGRKGLQISHHGCPPLLDVSVEIRRRATDCRKQNDAVLDLLTSHKITRVVLVANWGWYAQGRALNISGWPVALHASGSPAVAVPSPRAMIATVAKLRERGIEVAVVGPVPEVGWSPPRLLAMEAWRKVHLADEQTEREFMAWQATVFDALRAIENDGAIVVYPHRLLCDEICHAHKDGAVFYADSEHMTLAGLQQIRPALEELFARTGPRPGPGNPALDDASDGH